MIYWLMDNSDFVALVAVLVALFLLAICWKEDT